MKYTDKVTADFSARPLLTGLDSVLAHRWSPRAFVKQAISDADVNILFEAARCAPSCFNDQPWTFYVSTDKTFDDYLNLLVDANKAWAKNASLLCFATCNTLFGHNGKNNDYAPFDTGAAWMSVAYQARTMGLYTHGMGGIFHDKVAAYLQLTSTQKVICGIAIGVAESHDKLDETTRAKEIPNSRKALSEILKR
jgi:nitroreductase